MQFTFNIPDAQVPRVTAWVRSLFPDANEIDPGTGQPHGDPTNDELLAEFKQQVRNHIKNQVQQYELLKEHEQVFANYTPIDPTDV